MRGWRGGGGAGTERVILSSRVDAAASHGAQTRGAQLASWDLLSLPLLLGLLVSCLCPTWRLRSLPLSAVNPLGTSPSLHFLGREMSSRAGFPSISLPRTPGQFISAEGPWGPGRAGPRCLPLRLLADGLAPSLAVECCHWFVLWGPSR